MTPQQPFDPLKRFAEIERLVSRIYYRFSHLSLQQTELRDFWWEMAREEEQHACILSACGAVIANFAEETLNTDLTAAKAEELKGWLEGYLAAGTASLTADEAFRIAMDIEMSEIDAIYSKLLQLGGPQIAKTMENLGVPASAQRLKLKAALRRFVTNPELLRVAAQL